MTTIERDEADLTDWPVTGDPDGVAMAFASVMSAIIESTPAGPVRAQAVGVAMGAHGAGRASLLGAARRLLKPPTFPSRRWPRAR